MREILALITVICLLLIAAGAITAVAVLDARKARAELKSATTEYQQTIAELSEKIYDIQVKTDRVAKSQNEALVEWNRRSMVAQTVTAQPWPPPKAYRGVGGPGPRR
jgi:hypothetical protein